MTRNTRQLYFPPTNSGCFLVQLDVRELPVKFPNCAESYSQLRYINSVIWNETHPPGADSSSLSSTQKFFCLHPFPLGCRMESRGPSEAAAAVTAVAAGRGSALGLTQTRLRFAPTRVLERCAPAPCAARGQGRSGGRPVWTSPAKSHTEEQEEEEEEGCPRRYTESKCWRDAVDSVQRLPPHFQSRSWSQCVTSSALQQGCRSPLTLDRKSLSPLPCIIIGRGGVFFHSMPGLSCVLVRRLQGHFPPRRNSRV